MEQNFLIYIIFGVRDVLKLNCSINNNSCEINPHQLQVPLSAQSVSPISLSRVAPTQENFLEVDKGHHGNSTARQE